MRRTPAGRDGLRRTRRIDKTAAMGASRRRPVIASPLSVSIGEPPRNT